MSKLQVSDMLARAFAAEGVEVLFTLMGDANMYWSSAMAKLPGVKVVHARHEHCAVSMADGYARATGKVGVASVTCGPGYTQIMTALTMAARGNIPLVVFAGDAPRKNPSPQPPSPEKMRLRRHPSAHPMREPAPPSHATRFTR